MLHLRRYNGQISFVPAPGFETYGEPTGYNGVSTITQNVSSPSQEQPAKVRQYGYRGPDVNLMNMNWRTIEGPFVSVWLHNVPWGTKDTMAAPDAKVGLSCIPLMIHNLVMNFFSFFLLSFALSLYTHTSFAICSLAFSPNLVQLN